MITKRPLFIDTAHWKIIPNFVAIDPVPRLIVTKATEGVSLKDKKFDTYYPAIREAGYARGCFHFHRKAADPLRQAQFFCNTIRPYVVDSDILVLDVEEGGETAHQLKTFLQEVQSQFPRNQVWMYSRKNILEPIPTLVSALQAILPLTVKALDKYAYGEHPLNLIPMSISDREYFKTIKIWTAGYPSNPDLYDSVPSFYVPDPTRWGPVIAWQYSEKGKVEGIYGNVDMTYLANVDFNWMSPELIEMLGNTTPPPSNPDDVVTYPFAGVTRITGTRHGWDFSLLVSDPDKVAFAVVHPDYLTQGTKMAGDTAAQIILSGGEWDRISQPKDYSVSFGLVYVARKEAVPSFMIDRNHAITIDHVKRPDILHAISGLRYIVQSGELPTYLDGSEPQYTEGHSRAIDGIDTNGHHMRLTSAGAYPNQGLTLKQAALIMQEYGAVTAFDEGGGGDVTEVINGILTNVPENPGGTQRYLPQFLLIYADELGDEPMPTTGTIKGTAKAGTTTNIKRMAGGSDAVASLNGGDYVYGEWSTTQTDIINFDHFYRNGQVVELGELCKCWAGNLTVVLEDEPTTEPPTDPPTDPPPSGKPAHIAMQLAAGSTIIITDENDNEMWKGTA